MKRTSCQQSVIRNQKRLCRKDNSSFLSHLSSLERKWNFTLIELLIVIAIIAILAGMLLPALNNARNMARTTDCANRQKQFGTTFMLYADTFKEWSIGNSMPAHVPSPSWTSGANDGKTVWYYLFAKGSPNSAGINCLNYATRGKRQSLQVCAASDRTKGFDDGNYAINDYLGQAWSRGIYNWVSQGKLTGDNTKGSFFKPATVPQPSSLAWMYCTDKYNSVDYQFYHNNRTMNPMLFVDLTVHRLKRTDIVPYSGKYRTLGSYYPTSGSPNKTSW